MTLLTKDELHAAARRVGLIESADGRTMRSVGHAQGLTVSDALAWAAEIERMALASAASKWEYGHGFDKHGVAAFLREIR